MFCPRCGRNLSDGDIFCPECGCAVREPQVPTGPEESRSYVLALLFMTGFAVMLLLSYYIGFFFLFFFFPVMTIGGGKSRWQFLLIGAMLGTLVGIMMRYIL